MSQRYGYFFVIFSALCFGSMGIIIKTAYRFGATPLQLLFLRLATASLLLWLTLLVRREQRPRLTAGNLAVFAALGLSFAVAAVAIFFALRWTSAAMVSILTYTYPMIVAVLVAVFFREKFGAWKYWSLGLSFAGCLLILQLYRPGSLAANWRGIALGLLSGIAYAIFNVIGQKTTEKYSPLVVSTYSMSYSLLFVSLLQSPGFLVNGTLSLPVLGCGVALGFVAAYLSLLFYMQGVAMLGASRASVVSTVEPAFTALLAWIILNEKLEVLQAAGGLLILAGVLAAQKSDAPPEVASMPVRSS